jgi:hypothetical protein
MAVKTALPVAEIRPRWPAEPIDPAGVDLDYNGPADELTLFFGGRPVPSYCDPFDVEGFEDVAIMVGMDGDDASPGEVVGIQVIPLLLGAVRDHPRWATLAWGALSGFGWDAEPLRAEIARFVDEIAELHERHWAPAPPIEEQLARLPRADRAINGRGA